MGAERANTNMKQRITHNQWNELTAEQKAKFHELTKHKRYPKIPHLSIGQMIDFLGDEWYTNLFTWNYGEVDGVSNYSLCDYLWQEVKEVLNTKCVNTTKEVPEGI